MKILYIITSLEIGGAEKLVVDITPLLANLDIEIDVLLFNETDTFLRAKLAAEGINVYSLSVGGSVYNPFYIFKLTSFLLKYDIVHSHNTACQFYVAISAFLLPKNKRSRLVTTEHSTCNRRRNFPLFKYLDVWMYKQYDAIIAISAKATEGLKSYLNINKYIYTINNGINTKFYMTANTALRSKLASCTEKGFVIMMVAGFRDEKDQDSVIKALTFLPEDYFLCLVGDGKRKEECISLSSKLGVSHRTFFLGIRDDVPNLLKMSDVVVMSSHWEGFGLAAVEGMAAGKPVVASNVAGLAEVVRDAGILFEPKNSKQLADIIKKLRTDTSYYNEVVEQCLKRAQLYDIHTMVDSYLQIYKTLL